MPMIFRGFIEFLLKYYVLHFDFKNELYEHEESVNISFLFYFDFELI